MKNLTETIEEGAKIVSDSVKKIFKYDYKSEMKKKLEKDIEDEKNDDSPRYQCETQTMSVNGYIELLKLNKYKKGINKCDIWFPGGYNKIDDKLKNVKIINSEQIFFAIPNCDNIVSKYNVWKTLNDYYGREKSIEITPETFLMDQKDDIKLLKNVKDSKIILKKKVQRKEGLKIMTNIDELDKLTDDKDYLIAQKYMSPFLVKERKINLRVYIMLSLYKGKMIIYVNKYGSCIYTKDKYDEKSNDFEKNITSYKMELGIYDDYPLTFEQFGTYLGENGYNYDKFMDKINHKISLFVTPMKKQLGDSKFFNNKCYQVFGLDFIVDENLEPYLLECNKGPEMKPKITQKTIPDKITDNISDSISELKLLLEKGDNDDDVLKGIKKCYQDVYKGYPKNITYSETLNKIEEFYKNEKPSKSYPKGYITGNGLKVQKDSLHLIGLIEENDNNGFIKITEL